MKKSDNSVYRDYVNSTVSIRNPLSVTLTSRQWVDGRSLDRISLERDVTHFLNRLNYRLFRKKYSRYGKRLGVFTVIEGDKNTHLHVHLQLECLDLSPIFRTMTTMRFPVNLTGWRARYEEAVFRRTNN